MLTAAWALKGDARGKLAVHSWFSAGMQTSPSRLLLPPWPFFLKMRLVLNPREKERSWRQGEEGKEL